MSKRFALGAAIKAIREAKGMPGANVANACLMSHSHLLNIEAGRRRPTPESLMRIAVALGVPLDAISVELPETNTRKAA